jgi:hypothetical protein
MKKKWFLAAAISLAVVLVGGALAFRHWHPSGDTGKREAMLALLPSDPSAVLFLDLEQFRSSAFLPQLLQWAPNVSVEDDYAKFVNATGFNYERDLARMAVARTGQGTASKIFAIAEGRFDRKKIEDYAGRSGQRISDKKLTVFAMDVRNSGHISFLTFLRDDRLAWTDDPDYAEMFQPTHNPPDRDEWQEHFSRLSGSAVFAVIRQDELTAGMIAQQAPGGFRSPQLATLLTQLQWITIGGKPEGNDLRVVAEGECPTESTIQQLKEFLGGILLLAQAGLSGPQSRKQMDPQLREGYLELLRTADVESVDRGASKSVRLLFEVTPAFLDALKKAGNPALQIGH